MPKRIQRKRTKGWRMPENAVYVGRPTKWGNPFKHQEIGRKEAVRLFGLLMNGKLVRENIEGIAADEIVKSALEILTLNMRGVMWARIAGEELRGKDLACWCPLDKPCHTDVLLELANA